eukprot:2053247-Rhodomonas_salina.1
MHIYQYRTSRRRMRGCRTSSTLSQPPTSPFPPPLGSTAANNPPGTTVSCVSTGHLVANA